MMKKTMMMVLIGAILCGCAGQTADPRINTLANLRVKCRDKAECDIYWAKAQVWVSQHSSFRIQTVTDSIINTYGPVQSDLRLAYQVVKLPNGDGSAVIEIAAACGMTMFPCRDVDMARADFKLYIRGVYPYTP